MKIWIQFNVMPRIGEVILLNRAQPFVWLAQMVELASWSSRRTTCMFVQAVDRGSTPGADKLDRGYHRFGSFGVDDM